MNVATKKKLPEKLLKHIFKKTDFTDCTTVIVAISGGSDSTALLFLLRAYLQKQQDLDKNAKLPKILAVTIDHCLRKESHDEAKKVAKLCYSLGVEHKIACWAEQKPQSAISEQARIARYELLMHEAEKANASVIMTGHNLNDQAETYKMRHSRGAIRGLAVMARESLLMHKVRLIRPLLQLKRQELRDYLHDIGQNWIDDPSNDDVFYERVRVRQSLLDEELDSIAQQIESAAKIRREQSHNAAQLFQQLNKAMLYGQFLIKDLKTSQIQHQEFAFLIANLAAIFGGASYFATDSQIEHVKKYFSKQDKPVFRFNLLGSLVEKNNKIIRIYREDRNIIDKTLAPKTATIWDGRYFVQNLQESAVLLTKANLSAIKTQILAQNIDKDDVYFPSLQTSLAISSRQGIDIPALNGKLLYNEQIRLYHYMQPFGWLVSGNDYALYESLRDFLAKKWQLFQGNYKKY